MEKILTFELICPFWSSFRNPSTVNVHVTYPFPPPTTLYGMLNAARGMPSDWHEDREAWQFALVIKYPGELVETFSKIMQTSRADQTLIVRMTRIGKRLYARKLLVLITLFTSNQGTPYLKKHYQR